MDVRRAFKIILLISTLGSLLACVQSGDFQALQGEVRRGLDQQDKQLRALSQQVGEIRKRLEAYEADRDMGRKQMADHLNDFMLLQQEIASLRGQVETWTHRGKGLEQLAKTQTELREELQTLQESVGQTPSKKPPTASSTPASPQPKKRPEDLYKEARFHFEAGDYGKAREAFQNVLKEQPSSELGDNAQFWIGECYFREGNFKQAILEYEKVVSQYPNSSKVPSALLKQGMAFEKLEDLESARYLYRKITKEHPKSDQAQMAEHRLKLLP